MKLVFGVGIGLIIGAILPSLFGRGNHAPKPVTELRAWNVRASETTGSATADTQAPPWTPPRPQATLVTPQVPPAGVSPQPPQVGEYLPAALKGPPAWSPPRATGAPPTAPPAPGNVTPDYARTGPPPGRADDRRDWQADSRNDPAARYRGGPAVDYRGNPIESPAPRRDGQAPGGGYDSRYNNVPDNNGARPGSPLMPAGNNGAGGGYRNPQDADPGVARFDGTISAPPARTN